MTERSRSLAPRRVVRAARSKLANVLDESAGNAAQSHRAVYCGDHVVLTQTVFGRLIYLDMRDAGVSASIAMGRAYEPHVAAVLRRVCRPGDTFFDVGANVGYHSLAVWDVVRPDGGSIHMFEPNPQVRQILERTRHANAMWRGVTLAGQALSDAPGVLPLTIYGALGGSATLSPPEDLHLAEHPWEAAVSEPTTVDVELITGDQYCADHGVTAIDVMKVDVEGHEVQVLHGLDGVIGRSPRLKIELEFTFGAYADAPGFWAWLSERFPYRHAIDDRGELIPVDTLADLRAVAKHELIDTLLSKEPVLPPT